jgi:hypothetical protein
VGGVVVGRPAPGWGGFSAAGSATADIPNAGEEAPSVSLR